VTRVEVLDREDTAGNLVVLDLTDLTVSRLKNYLPEETR
jgi:hypothetical protein